VLSGRLERKLHQVDHDIPIGGVSPGGIVGDLGMFGISHTRSFTVTAEAPTALLILTAGHFEDAVTSAGGPKSLALFRDSAEMQNLMADVESFVNLPCFKNLDRDFVMRLRENSEPRLCYPKQVLMKEGHFGEEMYILRCGEVKIEKAGRFVAEMATGSVVGELAVLGTDKRRTATVTCTTLCLMRVLHTNVFHEILEMFPSSKRMVEHSYIGKSSKVQVTSSAAEKAELDAFYGRSHPRRKSEVEEIVDKHIIDLSHHSALSKKGGKQQLPTLPKLALQNGRVVNMTPRTCRTA